MMLLLLLLSDCIRRKGMMTRFTQGIQTVFAAVAEKVSSFNGTQDHLDSINSACLETQRVSLMYNSVVLFVNNVSEWSHDY